MCKIHENKHFCTIKVQLPCHVLTGVQFYLGNIKLDSWQNVTRELDFVDENRFTFMYFKHSKQKFYLINVWVIKDPILKSVEKNFLWFWNWIYDQPSCGKTKLLFGMLKIHENKHFCTIKVQFTCHVLTGVQFYLGNIKLDSWQNMTWQLDFECVKVFIFMHFKHSEK